MTKKCFLVVALLSLALAGGCAKGGNGAGVITIDVTAAGNADLVPVSQSIMITATVKNTSNTAVTWALSGTGCTGSACGTLTPVTPATNPPTATYVAPATPPSPATVTITATLVADSAITGTLNLSVKLVKVYVTPQATPAVTVGQGLLQQFTAVAIPDNAPQTFTWQVTCTSGTNCGSVSCGSDNPTCSTATSGAAVFQAGTTSQSGVLVQATSSVPETPATDGIGTTKVTVVAADSRLAAGTYGFQFSGYDASNPPNPVAVAGSLTVGANGAITSGVEDVETASKLQQYTITSGSYTPCANSTVVPCTSTAASSFSNSLGALTLNLNNGVTDTYTAVLTASGNVRMIESDSLGTGSGVMQMQTPLGQKGAFNPAVAQTFAFGFTGVDSTGNRVGYAGILATDGTGIIADGLLDANDNGTNVCGAQPPCSVTGTYSYNSTTGVGHMTLNSASTLDFDFFVAGGLTQTTTGPGALTLYAISTGSTYQTLSGSMVYQVLMTYDNQVFCPTTGTSSCTSVSNLAGANANVALIVGTTDGTSSGTGGTGGFSGAFDQNNNGTILSVSSFPSATQSPNPYTYVATNGNLGRFIFQMLGNPNATSVVAPIPFVLYASGADRGFLLDQSSAAVMTGTMDPQPSNAFYATANMPGTYSAATIGSGDPALSPLVENLLFTYPAPATTGNFAGVENPGDQPLAGTYSLSGLGLGADVGTVTLTAPAAATYAIYAIDVTALGGGSVAVEDFMMIGTTSGTPSPVIFAQQ